MPIPWCSQVEKSSPYKRFLRVLFCFLFFVYLLCFDCLLLFFYFYIFFLLSHCHLYIYALSYPISRHADDFLDRFIVGNLAL